VFGCYSGKVFCSVIKLFFVVVLVSCCKLVTEINAVNCNMEGFIIIIH